MRTGPAVGLIIVAIVLVAGVFYLEDHKGQWSTPSATTTPATGTSTVPDYYQDVSSWQAYQSSAGGFSVSYPIDFSVDEPPVPKPSTDWRLNSSDTGTIFFTLTIPAAFEPQTNFSDAKLTIGESMDKKALAGCLTQDPSGPPATATTTASIDGVAFTVFKFSDAGAGNLYDTTSYRAVHAGTCYAIEYTIHSSQLANYPASYNLIQFDETKLTSVLDRIVGTFSFL